MYLIGSCLQGRNTLIELELIRTYIAARDRFKGPQPPLFSRSVLRLAPAASSDSAVMADGVNEAAKKGLQRLDDTAEILRYREEAPAFFAALRGLALLQESSVADMEAATRELLTRDYTLEEVGRAVRDLRSKLFNMMPANLSFVSLLHARGGLLAFLETFETLESFGSQGEPRSGGLLACVVIPLPCRSLRSWASNEPDAGARLREPDCHVARRVLPQAVALHNALPAAGCIHDRAKGSCGPSPEV